MIKQNSLQAFRGSIFHCLRDPGSQNDDAAVEYFEDGLLLVADGRIAQLGPAETLLPKLPSDIMIADYSGKLILPGFIDTHVHYPQCDMIASHGEQLLDWLNKYTFPTETKFEDSAYARDVAEFFLDELLRNGTTTALTMATSHPNSVDIIFEAAQKRNMCMLAGKINMDRNGPENLLDTPETGYRDSKQLLEKWHKQDRLLYAITPRFAPTSTDQQLQTLGQLTKEHPDAYIHSHVAENQKEIAWAAKLFPWSRSYLDIYDRFGLLRERSVYAHGIYLDQTDRERVQQCGGAIAFCPTSNTFLGSGLFDYSQARDEGIRVGLATDMGAGTSFSMLQTLSDAYKVQQLANKQLSPLRGIYLATLGGAEALYLDHKIGNFETGKEADFIVLDYQSTPLIKRRIAAADTLAEKLFILMMLGDDRAISATYILGQCAYQC